MIDDCGLHLSKALVDGIAGKASRSDLDTLIRPLRRLVFRGRGSKSWLELAFLSESFPSQRVTGADKKVFLQTVLRYV